MCFARPNGACFSAGREGQSCIEGGYGRERTTDNLKGYSSALPCVLQRRLAKAIPEPKSQCPLWSHTPKHRGSRQLPISGSGVWPSSAHGGLSVYAAPNEKEEESNPQQSPSNSVPRPMLCRRLLTVTYVFFCRPCVLLTLCVGASFLWLLLNSLLHPL